MNISDPKSAVSLGLDHISTQVPSKMSVEDSPEAIREAAKAFEAIFMNEIMKSMRKTLPKDGMLSKGFANGVFNSMLDQEYSQIASRSGQLGLTDILTEQLGGDRADNVQKKSAADRVVEVDGEEIPAWAMEEILDDPWTPKQSPGVVAPGLSTPIQSEFTQSTRQNIKARAAYKSLGASHTGKDGQQGELEERGNISKASGDR